MGIFTQEAAGLYTTYRARIEVKDRLIGGVPNDPNLVEGWIAANVGAATTEEQRRQLLLASLIERGVPLPENPTFEEVMEAAETVADTVAISGFKRDEGGLYIESRQIMAMLREGVNVIWQDRPVTLRKVKTGTRAGEDLTKNAKAVFVERVDVDPNRIHLERNGAPVAEADGVQLFIGHIEDKKGRRSTLNRHEYVERVGFECEVSVLRDYLSRQDWAELWVHCEKHALGSLRSQDFGKFDVVSWDRLS